MADGWKVTEQLQTPITGPGGVMQEGWKISYTTDDGTVHGHVTIPAAQLSAETVRSAIERAVGTHNEIASL